MKIFQTRRRNAEIAAILYYIICGLLLLLFPGAPLLIANYVIATILSVVGLYFIVAYFQKTALEGLDGIQLASGLILITTGILLMIYPEFIGTLIPVLLGISLLAGGTAKLQMAVDLKRLDSKRWWIMLIGALVSITLGTLSLIDPTSSIQVFYRFVGISLLVEAVLDFCSMLYVNHHVKEYRKTIEI